MSRRTTKQRRAARRRRARYPNLKRARKCLWTLADNLIHGGEIQISPDVPSDDRRLAWLIRVVKDLGLRCGVVEAPDLAAGCVRVLPPRRGGKVVEMRGEEGEG